MAQSKLRVLVVEDRPVQAKLISKMLEVLGCETQAAGDGGEAVKALHGFRPHVVFLDIGLPDMDGYQLADLIRKDLDFKEIAIIALTGYGLEGDLERSKAAGIDQHLVKPISVADLQKALDKLELVG